MRSNAMPAKIAGHQNPPLPKFPQKTLQITGGASDDLADRRGILLRRSRDLDLDLWTTDHMAGLGCHRLALAGGMDVRGTGGITMSNLASDHRG